ncbi:MAG: chitobiase/beta-hexosaminidase C-terminal domain-containing protein [Prevotella sp.]|nr:chitobiase/beta-hexosaminidase C-terminal domain-containing protein [Prevotella sp.]
MKISTFLLGAAMLLTSAGSAVAQGTWSQGKGTIKSSEERYITSATTVGAVQDLNFTQDANPLKVYIDTKAAMTVKQGSTFDIHVQSGASMKWCHAIIFVDWNRNYSFDDKGEQLMKIGQEAKGDPEVANFTRMITVPTNAAVGETRMRIQFTDAWHKKNEPGHSHSAEDYVDQGAVYDFVVNILETPSAGIPVASPAGGTYLDDQTVTLTSSTPDASIYYTLNGSIPSKDNGTLYNGSPITIAGAENAITNVTLKAIAVKEGINSSSVVTENYIIKKSWNPGQGTRHTTEERFVTSATTEDAVENLSFAQADNPNQVYINTGSKMTVEKGSKFKLHVKSTAPMTFEHAIIFVDWNKNYSFDDAGEQLMKIGKENSRDDEVTDFTREISVPETAITGETRMRIQFTDAWHKNNEPADHTHTAEDFVDKGGVYDFIVNIVEPTPVTTYTVAGTPAALFGEEWKPEAEAGKMTDDDNDGIYTWTKENVEITEDVLNSADKVSFKVAVNKAWTEAYPSDNYRLDYLLPKAGAYSFEISFDPAKQEVKAGVYNTATITDAGYATFMAAVNTNYTDCGVSAYAVTVNGSKAMLKPYEGIVAGGTGVLLKGNADSYKIYGYNKADATVSQENALQVSDGNVTGDGLTIYVLNTGSKGMGFYPLESGKSLEKGKCYLTVSAAAGAKGFIAIGGETTGIGSVEATAAESGATYNIAGQRVDKNYKGIVIRNGKKYINK